MENYLIGVVALVVLVTVWRHVLLLLLLLLVCDPGGVFVLFFVDSGAIVVQRRLQIGQQSVWKL